MKRVELYANNKLTDLNGLAYLSESLENLEIEKCKKITDYTPILELKKLKRLRISSYDKEKIDDLKQLKNALREDIKVIIYPVLK